jgi:lipopolysaccharide assembly LptE-like protein
VGLGHWSLDIHLTRFPTALLLAAFCALLASCTNTGDFTIGGYTTATQFPAHIRTVRVPIFKNETFVRGLEFELTEAVVKQIELKSKWKVVHHDGADAELTGKIVNLAKRIILENPLNEVREAELQLAVEVEWRDCHACPPTGDPLPPVEPERPQIILPGQPVPLRPKRPVVLVQDTATFIPELGESYATARKRVVDRLAEQIVSMLEAPW